MKYTKTQAVEIVGSKVVEEVEALNCEPTGRVIYPAFEPEHEGMQEFSATLSLEDGGRITAYYYQSDEDLEEYNDDISMLVWEVEHFEIE